MSYHDCRTDENYNQKYLNKQDATFVDGYDWCAENVVDIFFDNIKDMFPEDSYLGHVLFEKLPKSMQDEYDWIPTFGNDGTKSEKRAVVTYVDLLRENMIDWIEGHRDELIVSMIDHMSEEEYQKIREQVDSQEHTAGGNNE